MERRPIDRPLRFHLTDAVQREVLENLTYEPSNLEDADLVVLGGYYDVPVQFLQREYVDRNQAEREYPQFLEFLRQYTTAVAAGKKILFVGIGHFLKLAMIGNPFNRERLRPDDDFFYKDVELQGTAHNGWFPFRAGRGPTTIINALHKGNNHFVDFSSIFIDSITIGFCPPQEFADFYNKLLRHFVDNDSDAIDRTLAEFMEVQEFKKPKTPSIKEKLVKTWEGITGGDATSPSSGAFQPGDITASDSSNKFAIPAAENNLNTADVVYIDMRYDVHTYEVPPMYATPEATHAYNEAVKRYKETKKAAEPVITSTPKGGIDEYLVEASKIREAKLEEIGIKRPKPLRSVSEMTDEEMAELAANGNYPPDVDTSTAPSFFMDSNDDW